MAIASFLKYVFIDFREGRGRERNNDEIESLISYLLHTPGDQTPNPSMLTRNRTLTLVHGPTIQLLSHTSRAQLFILFHNPILSQILLYTYTLNVLKSYFVTKNMFP